MKCENGYFGKYCILENHTISPFVEDYSYTWIQLSFNNTKHLNNHSTICQYNENGKSEDWMEIDTKRNETFYFCNITSLKPGKSYQIEVIVMNYTETYFYEKIGSLNQTTKCNEFNISNIRLYQHNRSIEVFMEPETYWCLDESINVTASNSQSYKLINLPIKFENMLECYEYNLTFSKKLSSFTFQTHSAAVLQGVSQTSATIKWPNCSYTPLEEFSVKYQVSNYAYCTKNHVFEIPKKVEMKNRIAIFENLRLYTNYKYYIFPANKTDDVIYYGYFFTSSDDISTDELPENVSFENEEIIITQCDCSKLKGNITYILHINCTEKWCREEGITKEIQYDFHSSKVFIKTEDFKHAFSKYSVEVTISRNLSLPSLRYSNRINFKTQPSKPSEVKNVTEYSSNRTTVWIRWLPPYPPTGKILDYNISITSSKKNNVNKSIEDCKFWPGFVCCQVEVSEENTTIGIRALNENVNEESQEACITLSRPEDLSKLEDLQARFESSAMTVMWKAPYYLNGATSFVLNVSVIKSEYNKQDQNNTIPLENITTCGIYVCVKVKSNFGTEYKIAVSLKSKYEGPQTAIHVITPPPQPIFSPRPYIDHCAIDSCKLILPTLKNFSNNCTIYVFTSRPESKEQFTNFNKLLPEDLSKFLNVNSSLYLELRQYKPSDSSLIINITGLGHSTQHNNLTILVLNEFCGKFNWTFYHPILVINTETATIIMVSIICVICFMFVIGIFLIISWIRSRYTFKENRNVSRNQNVESETTSNIQVDPTYSEIIPLPVRAKIININNFESYFKQCVNENHINGQRLIEEHKSIPMEENHSFICSKESKNRKKNRESPYYAYDHSRVVLKNYKTSYIHGNYIKGYNNLKTYIATQFPLPNTINDFWYMIWQENVEFVIMLINPDENEKLCCTKYWPNIKDTIMLERMKVTNVQFEKFSHYTMNVIEIKFNGQGRLVKHLNFTDWPDNGIPTYPTNLIPFLKTFQEVELNSKPAVVHCSNGFGNTGVFILCDIALEMIKRTNTVDFGKILLEMREQRIGMVEDYKQYILAHFLVFDYLNHQNFAIQTDALFKISVQKILNNLGVSDILKYLDKIDWYSSVYNILLPGGNFPFNTYPTLNPVSVDYFNAPDKFFVMKCPPKNHKEEFWNFLIKFDIDFVVYLNDTTAKTLWPKSNSIQYTKSCQIECNQESRVNVFKMKKVTITYEKKKKKVVEFLNLLEWKPQCLTPPNSKILLDAKENLFSLSDKSTKPILVMCSDGVTASGLFVALAYFIEKIKQENSADIVLAINMIRKNCKEFVKHKEQIEFLYYSALDSL